MQVGLTRLELLALLIALGNVLDEDFGATTGQQVLLIGVELQRGNLR